MASKINILCPAKLNLFLNVGKKRKDNYHELDTVFQRINLYDNLHIEKAKTYELNVLGDLKADENNLCTKAYRLLEPFLKEESVKITLEKEIPIGAGLGGGSSNAAMVLKGVNELLNLNIPKAKLLELAKTLGADVPFFLMPKTQRAKGIGEKFIEMHDFSDRFIYLVNPKISISSAKIYDRIDFIDSYSAKDFLNALNNNEIKKIQELAHNSMERIVFKMHPEIETIKEKLIESGAYLSLMSGSGSSVFGIFEDKSQFDELDKYFESKNFKTYRLKTVGREKYV
ncbi:MAG: 4-(cytidine 5'-diphospho)-2-C-methyl-D-erythritol kinase [Tissierellia bacterium]|nr:4-(cytidine 5'-diphospho)-2-C-methyl-D-erythritol kinase [Tissierellia bacterium]